MKTSWSLFCFLIAIASFAAGCTAVTATVPIASLPDDAAACTAATLRSLGYEIVDDSGPEGIKAERDKHVRNPLSARGDSDRVTVVIANEKLRVVGESVRVGDYGLEKRRGLERARGGTQTMRMGPSRQVRADVDQLTRSCGSAGD